MSFPSSPSSSSTPAASAVASHPDLLPHILSYLPDSSLFAALQVSSTFFAAATPILYHTVTISPLSSLPGRPHPFVGCTRSSSSFVELDSFATTSSSSVPASNFGSSLSSLRESKNSLLRHIRSINVYTHAQSACPFVNHFVPTLPCLQTLHLAGRRYPSSSTSHSSDSNSDSTSSPYSSAIFEHDDAYLDDLPPEQICTARTCQLVHKSCTAARSLIIRDLSDLRDISSNRSFRDISEVTIKLRWCQLPAAVDVVAARAPGAAPVWVLPQTDTAADPEQSYRPRQYRRHGTAVSFLPSTTRLLRIVFWDELHAFRFSQKQCIDATFAERTRLEERIPIARGHNYVPFPLPRDRTGRSTHGHGEKGEGGCCSHDMRVECNSGIDLMRAQSRQTEPVRRLENMFEAIGAWMVNDVHYPDSHSIEGQATLAKGNGMGMETGLNRPESQHRPQYLLSKVEVYNPPLSPRRTGSIPSHAIWDGLDAEDMTERVREAMRRGRDTVFAHPAVGVGAISMKRDEEPRPRSNTGGAEGQSLNNHASAVYRGLNLNLDLDGNQDKLVPPVPPQGQPLPLPLPPIILHTLDQYPTSPHLAQGEIDPPELEYYTSVLNPSPGLQHLRHAASEIINSRSASASARRRGRPIPTMSSLSEPPTIAAAAAAEAEEAIAVGPDDLVGWNPAALRVLVDSEALVREAEREKQVRAEIRALAERQEQALAEGRVIDKIPEEQEEWDGIGEVDACSYSYQ